jgi:molybdate transport system substrate-binding protein
MPRGRAQPVASALPRRRALAAIGALGFAPLTRVARAAAPAPGSTLVAAASDLKFALDEIAAAFTARMQAPLRIAYGSSGNFYRQIVQGAPFELFLSADEAFVRQLAEQGLASDRGELYGIGRIVLFAPRGAAWQPDSGFTGLAQALRDGHITRFAIANPAHAPYGRAAQQALQRAGLWAAIEPKLVLGENATQAVQFATSGSAQGGIFPLSLALAPAFAEAGRCTTLPDTLHEPLRQRMVLTRRAGATARALYRHLQAPEARAVLRRYGFALPGQG